MTTSNNPTHVVVRRKYGSIAANRGGVLRTRVLLLRRSARR